MKIFWNSSNINYFLSSIYGTPDTRSLSTHPISQYFFLSLLVLFLLLLLLLLFILLLHSSSSSSPSPSSSPPPSSPPLLLLLLDLFFLLLFLYSSRNIFLCIHNELILHNIIIFLFLLFVLFLVTSEKSFEVSRNQFKTWRHLQEEFQATRKNLSLNKEGIGTKSCEILNYEIFVWKIKLIIIQVKNRAWSPSLPSPPLLPFPPSRFLHRLQTSITRSIIKLECFLRPFLKTRSNDESAHTFKSSLRFLEVPQKGVLKKLVFCIFLPHFLTRLVLSDPLKLFQKSWELAWM